MHLARNRLLVTAVRFSLVAVCGRLPAEGSRLNAYHTSREVDSLKKFNPAAVSAIDPAR